MNSEFLIQKNTLKNLTISHASVINNMRQFRTILFSTTFERLWNHLFHCWKHVAIICRPNIWFFYNLHWIYLEQCLLPPYLQKNPFWFPPSLTFVSVPLFQFSQIWGTYYTILVNKYDFKLVVLQSILLSHRHLKHLNLLATKSWSCWELLNMTREQFYSPFLYNVRFRSFIFVDHGWSFLTWPVQNFDFFLYHAFLLTCNVIHRL